MEYLNEHRRLISLNNGNLVVLIVFLSNWYLYFFEGFFFKHRVRALDDVPLYCTIFYTNNKIRL